MPKIYNLHKKKDIPFGAVRIDRQTKFGNPFPMLNDSDEERNRVCDEYETWVKTRPRLIEDIKELKGKDLACWCVPKRCHGETIMRIANEEI